MERYQKLLIQFNKLKSKYETDTNINKNKSYDAVFNNILTYLNDLKTAIEKNNNKEIIELSAQIRILMDSFKLLLKDKRKIN